MAKRGIFQDTYIRINAQGEHFLVNHPGKGWSSFAYRYDSLEDLLGEWDLNVGEHGEDAVSPFIKVSPRPEAETEPGDGPMQTEVRARTGRPR